MPDAAPKANLDEIRDLMRALPGPDEDVDASTETIGELVARIYIPLSVIRFFRNPSSVKRKASRIFRPLKQNGWIVQPIAEIDRIGRSRIIN